ncbi:MAG: hypothetical protein ACK5NK_10865 [Niabella sp.]
MSSQHKLYNYEVSPPAGAWERIAQELNDVNEYKNISNKLHNLQVDVPAPVWDRIDAALSEEKSLDIIAAKLSDIEVMPPISIWDKLQTVLDSTESTNRKPAPVISIKKRITKYAVAAITIGIVVLTAFLFIQKSNNKGAQIASFEEKQENSNTVITQTLPDTPVTEPKTDEVYQPVTLTNVPNHSSTTSHTKSVKQASKTVTTSRGNTYATTVEKNHETNGRYIVLMTEEGNVVRMNKKVSRLADCIAGEDPSHECNSQISKWQKEIANMPVLASPDNILGLLELATKEPVSAEL